MASAPGPLAERAEIHRSCKTLESVVNILNDYCEAASAVVVLQKKLAKALRESASVKCVAEIPGALPTLSCRRRRARVGCVHGLADRARGCAKAG